MVCRPAGSGGMPVLGTVTGVPHARQGICLPAARSVTTSLLEQPGQKNVMSPFMRVTGTVVPKVFGFSTGIAGCGGGGAWTTNCGSGGSAAFGDAASGAAGAGGAAGFSGSRICPPHVGQEIFWPSRVSATPRRCWQCGQLNLTVLMSVTVCWPWPHARVRRLCGNGRRSLPNALAPNPLGWRSTCRRQQPPCQAPDSCRGWQARFRRWA